MPRIKNRKSRSRSLQKMLLAATCLGSLYLLHSGRSLTAGLIGLVGLVVGGALLLGCIFADG